VRRAASNLFVPTVADATCNASGPVTARSCKIRRDASALRIFLPCVRLHVCDDQKKKPVIMQTRAIQQHQMSNIKSKRRNRETCLYKKKKPANYLASFSLDERIHPMY
jgi:hypothetical protein